MKLGSTETPDVAPEEEGQAAEEAPVVNLLEDVLNEAATKASATDEEVKTAVVFDEKAAEFMSTYRISRADIGLTPQEVLSDMQGAGGDPSEYEEEILDALLFKGRYERQFTIGRATFTLTTFNSHVERHARHYMQQVSVNDPDAVGTSFNAMIVARSLAEVGGRPTCKALPGTKDFETQEAFNERMEFVLALPTDLLDAIGVQVNTFIRATSRAMNRNLSDF